MAYVVYPDSSGEIRPAQIGDGYRMYGATDGYVGLKPQTHAGSIDFTMPNALPSAAALMTCDNVGNLGTVLQSTFGSVWGGITGNISNQSDLWNILNDVLYGTNNLSDVLNTSAARINLGLGTASTHPAGDFILSNSLGDPLGPASLDSGGHVPMAQLPSAVTSAMNYQGTWNAATNTPTLTNGVGTKGYFYKCSVAGSTTIDGINQWNVGDSIVFDGTTWDKIDGIANEVITVFGRFGNVVATNGDYAVGQITGAQGTVTLTTTGASGNASFTSNTLNIPNYTYTLPTATNTVLGGVKPDNATITNTAGVLTVAYGTVANTAAQGNDSRITGALSTTTASSTYLPLAGGTLTGLLVSASNGIQWASSGSTILSGTGANVIDIRNGTTLQELRIFGTWSSSTSGEYLSLLAAVTTSAYTFGTNKFATGAVCGLNIITGGVNAIQISPTQHCNFTQNIYLASTSGTTAIGAAGGNVFIYAQSSFVLSGNNQTVATTLSTPTSNELRLGPMDGGTAVAQTFSCNSFGAGTTNAVGVNLTFGGSKGNGLGLGGNLIFQTSPAGITSGSTQNPLVTVLTLDSTGTVGTATFAGPVVHSSTTTISGTLTSTAVITSSNRIVTSFVGSASNVAVGTTSTPYASGTGTTNWPQIGCVAGTMANVTNWNTAGTVFGGNVAASWAGNFIDFHASSTTSLFQVQGTGALGISTAQTTLNGATSGTAQFSQPIAGPTTSSLKLVTIYCNVLLGATTTYSFPVAFTNTPMVLGTLSGIAAVTTTGVTLTGTTSTGNIIIIGY